MRRRESSSHAKTFSQGSDRKRAQICVRDRKRANQCETDSRARRQKVSKGVHLPVRSNAATYSLSATTLQMLPAPFLFNCWRDREPWIIECGSKTRSAHADAKQAALRTAVGGAPCAGAMRRVQSWVTVDLSAPK